MVDHAARGVPVALALARASGALLAALLLFSCGRSVRHSSPAAATGEAGAGGQTSSVGSAGGATEPHWVVENPSPLPNALLAAWASSETDLWVFGELGGMAHYDGTGWSVTKPLTDAYLRAAWGSAPNDVWAAGTSGTLVHFDGEQWSLFSAGSGGFSDIWGTAPDDVWT